MAPGRGTHLSLAISHMNPLTLFGVLVSIYGFLQGAWPFGVVEAISPAIAVQRWRRRLRR